MCLLENASVTYDFCRGDVSGQTVNFFNSPVHTSTWYGQSSQQVIQANPSMFLLHMLVARRTSRERLKAHPANMHAAALASHMVAAFGLFHRRAALGAVLDPVLLLEFLQHLISAGCVFSVLCARQSEVGIVAAPTGRDAAFGALVLRGLACGTVNRSAIGAGTVTKGVWAVTDV